MTEKPELTRRSFIETAGVATGAVVAASTFAHPAIGKNVKGANDRLNFAILGPGGRAQAHIGHLLAMKKEEKPVDIVAVCDVWDGNKAVGRGLYPSAERCGLDPNDKAHVTKDYRKLLESKDIDAVVIGTPDHWHAKMSIDAMDAGKDVYCEKPMTHTIDEARQVAETVKRTRQIFTVGVQSTAHPQWKMANELVTQGKIGKIVQGQTQYYRNSDVGQWRYYKLTEDMNPKTVDWKMFLGTEFGLAPEQPFNRARYAQWRCYWDFGGGMYTDLFVHQLTHLITAMGVRLPSRVVGGGGLYMEYDGREVPDVATVVADYEEGCQVLITATMTNKTTIDEVIRGHTGSIVFTADGFDVIPQTPDGAPAPPTRNSNNGGGTHHNAKFDPSGDKDTRALWDHFIECIRSRNPETRCPADLGYAAIATVNMGVQSYREGKALFLDKGTGAVTEADRSWAARWEERSKLRGKPNHVIGWKAGDEGSLLHPPEYQKLEGDWIDGEDPAAKA
ncbi:Gfo/Idh/MocA family protein [Singulisphaera acidiphila]|uniref:Putative dehydrogenase n=1 Tax=Singulisphaera acidiphila (strain ATCC BAA-1392 / DSM 18658 / VKM B-2454 / MOB10) TaxID=886293 RepID=L0DIL2_SINAD|nr:Gfo/Idh/MocA family oxidoreductase [Singulisphaera acidiphila]AGA29229.1 putative dehydrogenase [Singulisphaera acidiphila DSM 18658]